MRAVICSKFGLPEDLEVKEVEEPVTGANQVKLKVEACGVNFPDTLIINNKYQFKPDLPFSPGGEVAGIVEEVGEGVKNFVVGDKVMTTTIHGGFAEKLSCGHRDVNEKARKNEWRCCLWHSDYLRYLDACT